MRHCLGLFRAKAIPFQFQSHHFPLPVAHNDLETHFDTILKLYCNDVHSLKQVHSSLTTFGVIVQNPQLSSQVIIRYSKFGLLQQARLLFDCINRVCNIPNSFLWNTMVRAYATNGRSIETFELYLRMREISVAPNNYTYPFVFKACVFDPKVPKYTREVVHADAVKVGFDRDVFVEAALLDSYAKSKQIDNARKVFDAMLRRDLVCWTAMISAYEQGERPQESLYLFVEMQKEGFLADSITVVSIASAVGQVGAIKSAKSLHAYSIHYGMMDILSVANSIITMYAKCEDMESSRLVFDMMVERDAISWNSMLSGYVQNGQASSALLLFEHMQNSRCPPNPVTALIMVSAAAFLGSQQVGKKIHDFITDSKMKIDTTLLNALIDTYAKCGDLESAIPMFSNINPSERDVSSWNVIISGYGMHGRGKKALELYSQMQEEGFEPNHITFTSILSACSHAGLIDEGRKCFADMSKFSVISESKHYACMVDMLGRAGRLDEAFDLINKMPSSPNDEVWGALLLACRVHGNMKLGEIAAKNLFQLQPKHPGYFVLMSNMYAASRKWNEVGKLRQQMKSRGLKKAAAFSVIEFGNQIIGFHTADRENPYRWEVYNKVESLVVEMKMQGYVPDLSCVLHDVEEEDKGHILRYHSEKLAVTFGLMKIDPRSAILVTKNLRVCNDCHSAFKCLSNIYKRKIVVRDANRFHHFEGGCCSCSDYW